MLNFNKSGHFLYRKMFFSNFLSTFAARKQKSNKLKKDRTSETNNYNNNLLLINRIMKKIIFMVAACAAMVACKNGNTTANADKANGTDSVTTDSMMADSAIYEGVTPAADVEGIKYNLALATDSTNGFRLTESYMKSETEVASTENYTGKYAVVEKKDKDGKGKTYYQFPTGKSDKMTFLVLNDSTLRMVNSDFEEAVATKDMNYDLKLKK